MREVWIGALALQALAILVILVLAYTGTLPVFWRGWPGFDLLGHAVLFGTLGLLGDRALGCRSVARIRVGPALVLLLAVAEEALQTLSPHRTADPWDFLADVAGILLLVYSLPLALSTICRFAHLPIWRKPCTSSSSSPADRSGPPRSGARTT